MIYTSTSYRVYNSKPGTDINAKYSLQNDYVVRIECAKENFNFYAYYISSSGYYKILNLLKMAKNRRKPAYTATFNHMGLGFSQFYIKRLPFPLLRALHKLQPSWFGTFFSNGLPEDALPPKLNIIHKMNNNIAGSYTIEGVPIII